MKLNYFNLNYTIFTNEIIIFISQINYSNYSNNLQQNFDWIIKLLVPRNFPSKTNPLLDSSDILNIQTLRIPFQFVGLRRHYDNNFLFNSK